MSGGLTAILSGILDGVGYYTNARQQQDFQKRLGIPASQLENRHPVALWNQQGRTFTFGLPEGWREPTDNELDQLSSNGGKRVVAGGFLDGPPLQLITVHIESIGGESEAVAQTLYAYPELFGPRVAASQRMTLAGPPYRVLLGGQASVWLTFDGWTDGDAFRVAANSVQYRQSEIFVVRWASMVVISFQALLEDHSQGVAALETAAATWVWRS